MMLLMFFSLSLIGSVNLLTREVINAWEQKLDLSIYLKQNLDQAKVALFRSELENMPEVKEIHYITPEEALEQFKARHEKDPLILKSLEKLEKNPLGAAITVKLRNSSDYKIVLGIISNPLYQELIQNQDFIDFERLIDLFNKFSKKINWVSLSISGVFTFIAILVIFNTIKLGIYTRRDELKIMRLVGATSAFIRGPFLLESCLVAFFAWLLNGVILIPLVIFGEPYIKQFFGLDLEIFNYLRANAFIAFGGLLLFGLIIAILSSGIATQKYLKI